MCRSLSLSILLITHFGCGGSSGEDATGGGAGGDASLVSDDVDGDGVDNEVDNCPGVANNDQLDFDNDGVGDPCDPDPPPETCGDSQVQSTRIAPSIFVALDKSGSMDNNNKWRDARRALTQMSDNLADELRLGLALFAGSGGDCDGPDLGIGIGQNSSADFQNSYAGISPRGGTPIRLALSTIRDQGWLHDADDDRDDVRSKNVLLVTDGAPNCAVGHEDENNYSDLPATLTEAGLLKASNISVFVVGFGSGVDADGLNQIAEAGGTNNPDDANNRYFRASNADELESALNSIGSQVASCSLELEGAPGDPDRVYVLVDGKPLERGGADGFVYERGTNTVVLQGRECEGVRDNNPTIEVIFGCPTGGGPAIVD